MYRSTRRLQFPALGFVNVSAQETEPAKAAQDTRRRAALQRSILRSVAHICEMRTIPFGYLGADMWRDEQPNY